MKLLAKYHKTIIVIFCALLLGLWFEYQHSPSIDSIVVVEGAQEAIWCIEDGYLTDCNNADSDRPVGRDNRRIGAYPLFQYIPSAALVLLGVGQENILTLLALISTLAFFGTIGLLLHIATRLDLSEWKPVLILVMLTGPMLWYANDAFGEMLAAFLYVLFAATILLKKHWILIAVAVFLASITKETAAPVLFALGIVLALSSNDSDRPSTLIRLGAIAGGAVVGLAATALFNTFR